MPMGLLGPSSNPTNHFSQKVPTNADKRREAGEYITDCICECAGMGGNECGGSRAYRIVILVLWAYGPSTRIIYARLYYRHPFRYSLELVGMNPLLSLTLSKPVLGMVPPRKWYRF